MSVTTAPRYQFGSDSRQWCVWLSLMCVSELRNHENIQGCSNNSIQYCQYLCILTDICDSQRHHNYMHNYVEFVDDKQLINLTYINIDIHTGLGKPVVIINMLSPTHRNPQSLSCESARERIYCSSDILLHWTQDFDYRTESMSRALTDSTISFPQLPGGVRHFFPEAAHQLQPVDQSQQPFQHPSGDGGDQPDQDAGLWERPASLPADGARQRGVKQPQRRSRGQVKDSGMPATNNNNTYTFVHIFRRTFFKFAF